MEFTNAQKPTDVFCGLGVIPFMDPARAVIGMEEEEEVDGYATCLTEVAETAPFTEDEAGIAFDNANIRWVRTRVWRQPLADGGGDKEWWTAVPRTLPAGYTAVGRCNLIYIFGDFLGDNPMNGFSWNHRTPTSGYLLDTTTDEGIARSQWTPMNLNDQVLPVSLNNYLFSYIPNYPGSQFWEDYIVGQIASSHIGFRAAVLEVTIPCPGFGPTYPLTLSETFHIACADVTEPAWEEGDPPAAYTVLDSFTVGTTFALPSSPNYTTTVTLGELLPPAIGIVQVFVIYQDPLGAVELSRWQVVIEGKFCPRTDVPLPYFASQRNRVAPGGIVQPPP